MPLRTNVRYVMSESAYQRRRKIERRQDIVAAIFIGTFFLFVLAVAIILLAGPQ